MNIVAVANACAVECERQQVGVYELAQLIRAYHHVSQTNGLFHDPYTVKAIGKIVEPITNRNGFRYTPVTFRNGGTSANPTEIPRLMETLCKGINEFKTEDGELEFSPSLRMSAIDFLVKQFLWIHPFADGNGRVGFLLFNYLNGTLDNPKPLPDYFG